MTPTSSPPRTPPGSPRITPQVPANARSRRISTLRAYSIGFPGNPTLVMLTTGGPSQRVDSLIRDWQDSAIAKKCNFCAIEVGEAAKSDTNLPELLSARELQGAHLYIVKRDANVSEDEIQQVQDVLASLEIPVAWNEPLNADDGNTWVFPDLDEVKVQARVESTDQDLSPEGMLAKLPEEVLMAEYARLRAELDANTKALKHGQLRSFELDKHQGMLAREALGIGPGIEEGAPSLSKTIVDAFNQLQFSKDWQKLAGTPGAKVVCRTIESLYARLDDEAKSHFERFLESLFVAMRKDPVLLQSVLNAAAQVPASVGDVITVSRMCFVYMKHEVASGSLDERPEVALAYASSVQRFPLLEEIYQSKLAAVRKLIKPNPPLEVGLCIAFEAALTAVLRDAGKQGLPLQEDLMPGVADTIKDAWQEMEQRGNEGFKDFLAQPPWKEFISRSWAARLKEKEKK